MVIGINSTNLSARPFGADRRKEMIYITHPRKISLVESKEHEGSMLIESADAYAPFIIDKKFADTDFANLSIGPRNNTGRFSVLPVIPDDGRVFVLANHGRRVEAGNHNKSYMRLDSGCVFVPPAQYQDPTAIKWLSDSLDNCSGFDLLQLTPNPNKPIWFIVQDGRRQVFVLNNKRFYYLGVQLTQSPQINADRLGIDYPAFMRRDFITPPEHARSANLDF